MTSAPSIVSVKLYWSSRRAASTVDSFAPPRTRGSRRYRGCFDELLAGSEELADWADARDDTFFMKPDAPVIASLRAPCRR